MNRISTRLSEIKKGNGKLLVPFLTVGYPTRSGSLDLVKAAVDSGADFVEFGMPFSDPLADGPEIQHSSQIALANGTSLKDVLKCVEAARRYTDIPIILMGYFNPVLVYGLKRFAADAKTRGVDGFIIPDLPIEEAGPFKVQLDKCGLSSVFLVAPTTPLKRRRLIDRACSDFVYAVTVTGVTGTGHTLGDSTDVYLKGLKRLLTRPFVAGFGISTPATAKRLCRFADGVVVGSALIRACREARGRKEGIRSVARLLKGLRRVLK